MAAWEIARTTAYSSPSDMFFVGTLIEATTS